MILRIMLGLGVLLGILVGYPYLKLALESVITTVQATTPIPSTFSELLLTTLPYWGLVLGIVFAILVMVGGSRGNQE